MQPEAMATQQPSLIGLHLTPHFDNEGASALSVRLHIASPNITAHQPAFSFWLFNVNVPSPGLSEEDIEAEDEEGPLQVEFQNVPAVGDQQSQHWCLSRDTVGELVLSYTVHPRLVTKHTPLGARVDLRRDQGGLMGSPEWFLPRYLSDSEHTLTVEWSIPPDAPANTRYVWSYGEGPGPHTRIGSVQTLSSTVFMVGPIQSYPEVPNDAYPSTSYWFGPLLPNLQSMVEYSAELYPKMAAYFDDLGQTYRVFFRKSLFGFGGTGFSASYVVEYEESTKNESEWSLIRLSTHEMVHSFATLSLEENEEYDNAWYSEGIAEFYASVLPYRFGMRDKEFALKSTNIQTQCYYTSPRIHMRMIDAAKEFFYDWYAEWISYKRGNAYLILIDYILRRATGRFGIETNGPLDDIVIDICRRARGGQVVRSEDWLCYLDQYSDSTNGFPFREHFKAMLEGEMIDLSRAFLGSPEDSFSRCDIRILDYGLDRNSFRTWTVTGVQKESAAYAAGLRDGWKILSASSYNDSLENPDVKLRMRVKDDEGQEKTIEYLPRRPEKAVCYQIECKQD